jgi:putative ABC transport system permease protein
VVSALNAKLWRDLKALRMQGLSIALVVASGIAAYVASMSTHESLKDARDQHYEQTRFPDVFLDLTRAPLAFAYRAASLPGVAAVRAGIAHAARIDIAGIDDPLSARLFSMPDPDDIGRLTLLAGRWPRAGSNEILLGEAFAEKRGVLPGQSLRILLNGRSDTLVVTGLVSSPEYILGAAHGGLSDDRSFGLIWMDTRRLARALDLDGAFNTIALKLAPAADREAVIAELDQLLATQGGRGAYGREDQFSNRALSQEIAEQRVFATVLPVIFLAVAVFVLHVVLTRRVSTERDQIATLRALGYGAVRIASHYLMIALLIATAGAIIGVAIGAQLGQWLTGLYSGYFRFPDFRWSLNPGDALAPAAVALASAAVAASLSVREILKLSPSEAMQPPAPRVWRHRPRTPGSRRVRPIDLMILRTLLMRPLRSLFTLLGIAGSVAILISGSWWRDAIDHLLAIQFELAMPADRYLALQPAVAGAASAELQRLPGVTQVELQQGLPARLHGPSGQERTRLEALGVHDTLRRPYGVDGRPSPLPDTGVVLPQRLADRLGVRAGDSIEVELIEGRRRRQSIIVDAVFPEPMGRSAYIGTETLMRLNGTLLQYDQAALRIAPDAEYALTEALREHPRVIGQFRKAELLNRIRESSRRNMLVFSAVLTVFASAIAIGVIYNSARIALSERRWELATLRVLGMTEGEVARLLLGELALQTLIAMPIGCLAGVALARLLVSMMSEGTFTIPVIIWPRTYAWAIASVLLTSLISAVRVRRRLARLDLIGVLKVRE